jgi:hypothetical protein
MPAALLRLYSKFYTQALAQNVASAVKLQGRRAVRMMCHPRSFFDLETKIQESGHGEDILSGTVPSPEHQQE